MKAIKLQAYISSNRVLNLQLPQEVIEGPAEVIILMDDSAQAVLQTQPEMPALDLSQLQGLPDVPSSLTEEPAPTNDGEEHSATPYPAEEQVSGEIPPIDELDSSSEATPPDETLAAQDADKEEKEE